VARYAAVLGIVGAIDIPVIIVSVRLWRGIHPAVLMTREGTSGLLDPLMRVTLYFTAIGFLLLFAWLVSVRLRAIRCHEEIEDLHRELLPT
jgi:heme exporter protein C